MKVVLHRPAPHHFPSPLPACWWGHSLASPPPVSRHQVTPSRTHPPTYVNPSQPPSSVIGAAERSNSNTEISVSPASLRLPIRYPHQPAPPHSSLVDTT
ncbi:hypothetical protein Pcinc_042721 [Petrolisthes cinctipes]|uniref:Uncharacterized protein n=1 Tax=Petrolisthes cinctipes TaxID=88211 RepID=A0AAE1BJ66_PETCI|nr:hypothetical protein Pcinc_042721 [Petrolisthes cinctipes]